MGLVRDASLLVPLHLAIITIGHYRCRDRDVPFGTHIPHTAVTLDYLSHV